MYVCVSVDAQFTVPYRLAPVSNSHVDSAGRKGCVFFMDASAYARYFLFRPLPSA